MSPNPTQGLPAPQPLLPREARRDRPLIAIMAVMAFLAGLALLTSLWAAEAGRIWTSGLEGEMTVQVLDAEQAEAARAALAQLPEASAQILSDAEVDALLAPWLGNAKLPEDIEVPALISVRGEVEPKRVARALEAAGVAAEVDDHQRWADQVRDLALWVRAAAGAILLLILGAGAATSAFATEAAMRAEETVIRVLGQVGARDRFVSRLFTKRFFFAGLKAGALGALGAALFGGGLGLVFGAPFGVGAGALLWLIALAGLFGALAALSAARMARAQLRSDRAAL